MIPDYTPLYISERAGKPRNIDLSKKWTPLGLFLLFWTPELLQEVCNQTNSYGYRNQTAKKPWKPLHKLELLHFYGTCFLMGLHHHPARKYIYSAENGVLSGVPLSKNRREDILQMLHFLDRGEGPHLKMPYWHKYGKIHPYLRQKFQFYWEPGSRITVDEIMIRFEGRSHGVTTIPGKPVPTGFKFFALANIGYILNWECTAPGILEGENDEDISSRIISIPEKSIFTKLSNTQAVVQRLVSPLWPFITSEYGYHLYLDNLFVSWKLCYLFKQKGMAVTGTCRKGACGYPPRLSGFKTINCALKWGALQAEVVEGVFCFLWQNNNAVQGMTTGYNLKEELEKERKRPKPTSTSAAASRAAFGDEYRKILPIPGVIAGYNDSMGQVDAANQLRSYFTALPNRCEKEFFPGVFWSLDVALVNCYIIYKTLYPEQYTINIGNRDRNAHRKFMEAFIDEVFQYMDETLETFPEKLEKKWEKIPRGRGRPSLARSLSASQKTTVPEPLEHHQHIKTEKRSSCRVCGYIRQKISLEQEKKGAIRGANTT
jgi:hypothetical protein